MIERPGFFVFSRVFSASRNVAIGVVSALLLISVSQTARGQELPDSPVAHSGLQPAAVDSYSDAAFAPEPAQEAAPFVPRPTLTLRQRFILQTKTSFSPLAFVVAGGEAGITMADPPTHYPQEWSDGAAAYGRNYGAEIGRHTAAGYGHFIIAAIDREDPRYVRSSSTNFFARTAHALAFTIVDRSDSGHKMLALSNFGGAAVGGFAGMAWEPDGFNDVPHAYQRSAVEMSAFASHNLTDEFAPELTRLLHKLHLGGAKGALLPPPASTTPPVPPAN